jgi:hypothetical protein
MLLLSLGEKDREAYAFDDFRDSRLRSSKAKRSRSRRKSVAAGRLLHQSYSKMRVGSGLRKIERNLVLRTEELIDLD